MGENIIGQSWEHVIGVLEDNIFRSNISQWQSEVADLVEKKYKVPVFHSDRRITTRFFVSLPVQYRFTGAPSQWRADQSIDVSQNGVRIALSASVPVGAEVELKIKLPNTSGTVNLCGTVIWVHPSKSGPPGTFECGIAFESLRKVSQKDKIISFMVNRFCGLALKNKFELESRLAITREDLLRAYELVYQEYEPRGYCAARAQKLHYNYFSLLPKSRTFILEHDHKLVGTISLIEDSPLGLPMERAFPEQIGRYRANGWKMAEIGLLALDHQVFGAKSFSLTNLGKLAATFRLFKICFDYARFVAGVTDLVITMHPRHRELYYYLNFEAIGQVRSYQGAQGKPALPMHLNITKTAAMMPRQSALRKYFIDQKVPREILEKHWNWDDASVTEFLDKIGLWDELTPEKQAVLKTFYPNIRVRGMLDPSPGTLVP
jgi:hypothetical protein